MRGECGEWGQVLSFAHVNRHDTWLLQAIRVAEVLTAVSSSALQDKMDSPPEEKPQALTHRISQLLTLATR